MHTRSVLALLALVLVVAACGGGDGTTEAAPGTTAAAGASTTAPTAATTEASTTAGGGGDALPACDSLVGLDEAAALFDEPAEFDTEESQAPAGLGASICVWTSTEDPDDLEDLQVQLLQVQVYRGAEFYAPEMIYEDLEQLDGIGDEAHVAGDPRVSAGFLEGDLAVFVDFTVIFPQEAPEAITKRDQVVELLRLVHDRIS